MSSGGTNTVQSNSQPPPQFQAALTSVGQKAANDASVPFQPYTGQLVAGLSPDQQAGIQTIQGAQGITAPYINAAAQEIGNSTTPLAPTIKPFVDNATGLFNQAGSANLTPTQFSPGQVSQYESPYTQQVVNATQAQFNNQNEQQQAGISGNAISQGAFGGDREAVAHGIAAGQEQTAQAPVIANLENQGYAEALQEFNQQQQTGLAAKQAQGQLELGAGQGITGVGGQLLGANEANAWLDSQAGFGLGNLGNEALGSTLQEGNAQLGIGGLEQGQAQQELNVPYQQFLAQQAYPFQTDAWAAGLAGELANAAGGTASTTSPGPSPISQVAGLATTGLALNQLGAFNGLGSSLSGLGASSGTAAGLAAAGSFAGDAAAAEAAATAGDGIASGAGEAFGLLAAAKDGGPIPYRSGGGGIATFPLHRTRMPGVGGRGLFANDNLGAPEPRRLAAGGVAIPQLPTSGGGIIGRNGVNIPQLPTGPVARAGGGSGGGITSGSVSDYLAHQAAGASHAAPVGFVAPPPPPAAAAPPAPSAEQIAFQAQNDINEGNILNGQPGGMRRGGGLMARRAGGGGLDDDSDLPEPPMPPGEGDAGPSSGGGLMGAMPVQQPQGNGIKPPGPAPVHGADAAAAPTYSPWQALLSAGLGMMAGTSPHALTNIGKGGMQGLQFGEQQRARMEQQNLARLAQQETAKYHSGELDLRGKQIDQTGDLTRAQMAQTLALKQAEMGQTMSLEKMRLGMEGARLAEEKAYHESSLTPPELRIFNAYNKMSPEDQAHFSALNLAQKGIPDIMGGAGGMPPMAPASGAAADAAPATPSKPPGDALPGDVQAAPATTRNDAFLARLSPQYQPMVKALAEGRMAMPTRPSPLQQQLIAAAGQYDPTFDSTDFNKRSGTAKDFASGQSAKAVTAINTATSHLSSLSDQMEALHNGDIPLANSITNWWKTNTGQSAPTTATETRDAVANELRKVFATTGGGGLEELKEWQSHFPINGSPAQQKDSIRQAVDLMQPRMESLAHQWNTGMGTNHSGLELLSPSAQASWQKLTGAQSPVATAPAPTYNRPGGSTMQRPLQAPVDQTPPRVGSAAEAAKLPSGTRFLDPNGVMRMVP